MRHRRWSTATHQHNSIWAEYSGKRWKWIRRMKIYKYKMYATGCYEMISVYLHFYLLFLLPLLLIIIHWIFLLDFHFHMNIIYENIFIKEEKLYKQHKKWKLFSCEMKMLPISFNSIIMKLLSEIQIGERVSDSIMIQHICHSTELELDLRWWGFGGLRTEDVENVCGMGCAEWEWANCWFSNM